MAWSWRDGLGDEIVHLEQRAREDEYSFYRSHRAIGADKAAALARLLRTFERRVSRLVLGGTVPEPNNRAARG